MTETKDTRAAAPDVTPASFIRQAIDADIMAGKVPSGVVTRFPPEPNGYLHIGHAKSICLNFGIARDYPGAVCRLRFDDTNPTKERVDFMEEIQADVRWLGFGWGDRPRHASDYFEPLFDYAVRLIESGNAYVCSLDPEQIRAYRGTLTDPGRDSPYRSRPAEESLDLFLRMRDGEFEEGAHVLRAKIDMAAPNMNLRDPVIYRIVHTPHPLTGDAWRVYPMYDFAQALSDAIEGVTHSLCTLEFEDHRPLYEWFLETLEIQSPPRQIEFGRLNLTHTVMSKRYLTRLVDGGHVDGWDDPRMPTIAGMRRRGFTAQALRDFCERAGGDQKRRCGGVRAARDVRSSRSRAYDPAGDGGAATAQARHRELSGGCDRDVRSPEPSSGPGAGYAQGAVLARDLYRARRLHGGPAAQILPLRPWPRGPAALRLACRLHRRRQGCTDWGDHRNTRPVRSRVPWRQGARRPQGQGHRPLGVCAARVFGPRCGSTIGCSGIRRPAGTWSASRGRSTPDSLEALESSVVEPSLALASPGAHFQFERLGYFVADSRDHVRGTPVFNRTVTLRDTWGRQQQKARG